MKDYNIIITIGALGECEDDALTQYSDLLFFIKDNLPNENFTIDIVEVGELP